MTHLNANGYPVKQCSECQQEVNINSFVGELCITCHDMNQVKVWSFRSGDYNDTFQMSTIKGTGKQIQEYCLGQFSEFEDRKDEIESIHTDGIGYEIYYPVEIDPETGEAYEDQELYVEFFNEAREIEDYNPDKDGEIDIDLTKENN